jgi:hypothetical protein
MMVTLVQVPRVDTMLEEGLRIWRRRSAVSTLERA